MKRFWMVLLCIALLSASALAEAPAEGACGSRLGFALAQALYAQGKNCIVSPQSLSTALQMAAAGARGDTLRAMLDALEIADPSALKDAAVDGVESANAVFVSPQVALLPEYAARLNEDFAAEWFPIDETVVENVNAWTREKTHGLIEKLIEQAPPADTGMILANAISMDAEWLHPFEHSFEGVFYTSDRELDVEMMYMTELLRYGEANGMQLVNLPYAQGNLEMWVILPGLDESVETALAMLAEDGLQGLAEAAQARRVHLCLPKFDLSDERMLNAALRALGLDVAFTEEADFSGMAKEPMCIDSVVQKTRVQVDENGTRAAAVTAVMMACGAAQLDTEAPVQMYVNRPFVFVIDDAATGTVSFVGAVECIG